MKKKKKQPPKKQQQQNTSLYPYDTLNLLSALLFILKYLEIQGFREINYFFHYITECSEPKFNSILVVLKSLSSQLLLDNYDVTFIIW